MIGQMLHRIYGVHKVSAVLGTTNQVLHNLFVESTNQYVCSGVGDLGAGISELTQAVIMEDFLIGISQNGATSQLRVYNQASYLSLQDNITRVFEAKSVAGFAPLTLTSGSKIRTANMFSSILYIEISQPGPSSKTFIQLVRVNTDTWSYSQILFDGTSTPLVTQIKVMEDTRYITLAMRVDTPAPASVLSARLETKPEGLAALNFSQTAGFLNLSLEGTPFSMIGTIDFRNSTNTGTSVLKWTQAAGSSVRNFTYMHADSSADRSTMNTTRSTQAELAFKEEALVTDACLVQTFAIFLIVDATQQRCTLRVSEPRNLNTFDLNLKLLFGVSSASVICTDQEVIVLGISNLITKVIAFRPLEYLRVNRRLVGYFELPTTRAVAPIITTTATKLGVSFRSMSGASAVYDFWMFDRLGRSKFYFRGNPVVADKNATFPVMLIQTLETQYNFSFDLKIQTKPSITQVASPLLLYTGLPKNEDEKKYLYEPSPTGSFFNLEESFLFNQQFHEMKFQTGSASIKLLPRVSLLSILTPKQLTQNSDKDFCDFGVYGIQHFDLANNTLAVLGRSTSGFCVSVFSISRAGTSGSLQATQIFKLFRTVAVPEEMSCSHVSLLRDKFDGTVLYLSQIQNTGAH